MIGIGICWLVAPAGAGAEDLPSLVGPGADQPPLLAQPAGDIDGDGLGDLAVAAPAADGASASGLALHESGAVWWFVDVAGIGPLTPIDDAGTRLDGEVSQDRLGTALAALGDIDGDGYADLAAGTPDADDSAGRIYLILGGPTPGGGAQRAGDLPYLHGIRPGDGLGVRVAGLPDQDGDGRDEILAAAPYAPGPDLEPDAGWLALVYGASAWPGATGVEVDADSPATSVGWRSAEEDAWFGRAAAPLGLGAAGTPADLLIAAPGGHHAPGVVSLFAARDPADPAVLPPEDAAATLSGEPNDALAWWIVSLPEGAALSAPESGDGRVLAVSSDGDGLIEDGLIEDGAWRGADQELLGWGLAATGDLLDGAEIAAGAPGWAGGQGRVLLLPRPDGSGDAQAAALLEIPGCWADGETGTHVGASAGPDPSGADRAWLAFTSPAASVLASGDGVVQLLTADDLGLIDGDCAPATSEDPTDADGDGYPASGGDAGAEVDCDDAVAWRNPGAHESCGDGADDDCDGAVDESCGPAEDDASGRCASGDGGPGAAWLLTLLALARRRS